jgi:hypothetical protein
MPTWTYYAADLLTGTLLDELPLSGVQVALPVSDTGTLSADVPLYSRTHLAETLQPARTAIYADRDGQIVWGGILWGRRYDYGTGRLSIDCSDWLSYFDHLVVADNMQYNNVDQLAIARALLLYGEEQGQSDLHLAWLGDMTSTVGRTVTYLASEHTVLSDAVKDLAGADQGFDFRMTTRWVNSIPQRGVLFGYPTLGRPYSETGLTIDLRDATDFSWNEDGTGSSNIIYATGSAPEGGTAPAPVIVDVTGPRDAGYPRLGKALSFDGVTNGLMLAALAEGEMEKVQWPPVTMTVAAKNLDFDDLTVGDEAQVVIPAGDALFTRGATLTARITSLSVDVSDEFDETVSLDLTQTGGPALPLLAAVR